MVTLETATPLVTPSDSKIFDQKRGHSRSLVDLTGFRPTESPRSAKIEIQCHDRRQSVPLLDVSKKQPMKVMRNAAGMPIGEKPVLSQIGDITPIDTALGFMTLSQSKSPVATLNRADRPGSLDLSFESASSPSSNSEASMGSPPSDGEKKRRRKRSPRAQRERRENKRTVYLQPLPPSITESQVADMLSEFGRVQHVDWVGDTRAACFARFESQIEAKKALGHGAPLPGGISILSKKVQLEYIRAELGRLQNQHSALLEQLVPKRKLSVSSGSDSSQQFSIARRVSTSAVPASQANRQQQNHRRTRSEKVNSVLECDSSKNWRQNASPRTAPNSNNSRSKKFAFEDVRRHQRSMSELAPSSGPPRLNLKKPRRSVQYGRVAKGPDGSCGFSRHSQ